MLLCGFIVDSSARVRVHTWGVGPLRCLASTFSRSCPSCSVPSVLDQGRVPFFALEDRGYAGSCMSVSENRTLRRKPLSEIGE
jgi:hypothetical protein